MVESSQIRFSLYQENENGLSFWDFDLFPTRSTGHIYGYGITKIFVTICMIVCNISQKEACNIQHLFDSLPQGNWFEKFPPPQGGGDIQEYTPLLECEVAIENC